MICSSSRIGLGSPSGGILEHLAFGLLLNGEHSILLVFVGNLANEAGDVLVAISLEVFAFSQLEGDLVLGLFASSTDLTRSARFILIDLNEAGEDERSIVLVAVNFEELSLIFIGEVGTEEPFFGTRLLLRVDIEEKNGGSEGAVDLRSTTREETEG